MASPRIFQTGAMKLERSTDTDPHGGWGDLSSAAIVPATTGPVAFPWTTFDNALTINTTEDDSVTSNAFQASQRLVGKFVDLNLGMYDQYKSFGRFLYWYLGFEAQPKPTLVVEGTLVANEPVFGDDFTDIDSNSYVFIRKEITKNMDRTDNIKYVFEAPDGLVPSLPTGTLTNVTTAGDDIMMTSHSPLMYEHLFELDKYGRQLRDFTIKEVSNLNSHGAMYHKTGDRKSLFATFAKRFETYDMRYANALAKGFTLTWTPADKTSVEGGFLGYIQERADRNTTDPGYGSDSWSLPCDLGEGQMIPLHYQADMFVCRQGEDILQRSGTPEGYDFIEPITDATLGFETPLDNVQDTVSGVALANPLMEGKYAITASMTISRHVSQEFMDYRDGQTLLKAYIKSTQGWSTQEVFIKQFTLSQAGPDDSAVAQEPLEMQVGWDCDGDEFGELLQDGDGVTLEVNNSPILIRSRDENKYCQSTGRDILGNLEA